MLSHPLLSASAGEWFAWPAVEPAAGSALDVSALNLRSEPLPRVTVRDGRFLAAGDRLRFWGCNLTGAEALPATADEAEAIARRLAKAGVNLVRLHHLDNPWGADTGGSLWPAHTDRHQEIDPGQLDKLHRLIAALARQGIYSDLNLKVTKTLSPADGFAATVASFPDAQKRVDIFDRRMVELQKDYARQILTTKNPYTGLRPAEDPAVAIVEINNENSLLGYWTRDLGRGLDVFPEPFRGELATRWNAWLSRHYGDDRAIAAAWGVGDTDGQLLCDATARWRLAVQPGSKASIAAGGTAAEECELHIDTASGIARHVELSLGGLAAEERAVYTISFDAKADHPRKLGLGFGLDVAARPGEPWWTMGLSEYVEVGTDWRPVQLAFMAHSIARSPAALSLNAGQAAGTLSLRHFQLRRGASHAGLRPRESVANASIPIPTTPTPAQWRDWLGFLAEVERDYAEDMRRYLKDELRVQAALLCSQIDYGGLTAMGREQSMDFADAHAYWQHPKFPGDLWNTERWTIDNSPQLADLTPRRFGELATLALQRVAGRPYSVSEYDEPAPSDFACEMYPLFAAFASRQDWDMLAPYCIGPYGSHNPSGRIHDFFDQLNHPAKWSLSPFAALVFRRGLIEAAGARARLQLPERAWTDYLHAEAAWRDLVDGPLDFFNVRYSLGAEPGRTKSAVTFDPARPEPRPPVRFVQTPLGNVCVIDTPAAAAAIGYLANTTVEAGALRVSCRSFGRNFATVAAVALDGRPLRDSARVLVTVVARAGNQGVSWNEARTSLGGEWGAGPTVAEHVPALITLDGPGARKAYALRPDGARAGVAASASTGAGFEFSTSATDRTLHYEVVRE